MHVDPFEPPGRRAPQPAGIAEEPVLFVHPLREAERGRIVGLEVGGS